jgi:SAM-dependent methyltransferase
VHGSNNATTAAATAAPNGAPHVRIQSLFNISIGSDLSMGTTDAAWEAWGKEDPYFGVVTDPKYRRDNLTEDGKQQFFDTGVGHVNYVMYLIHKYVDASYKPHRALDFGCGVGRVLLPLARMAESVVGLDVSPSMIAEAKRNVIEAGLDNIEILPSDDQLSGLTGQFDLVHSCLVFQHIPVARGMKLFKQLLDRVVPGGIVSIQFIFAKEYWPENLGVAPVEPPVKSKTKLLKLGIGGNSKDKPLIANGVPIDPASGEPMMEMNIYPMNQLIYLAHQAGCERFHSELGNHGGELGIFFIMQKKPQ